MISSCQVEEPDAKWALLTRVELLNRLCASGDPAANSDVQNPTPPHLAMIPHHNSPLTMLQTAGRRDLCFWPHQRVELGSGMARIWDGHPSPNSGLALIRSRRRATDWVGHVVRYAAHSSDSCRSMCCAATTTPTRSSIMTCSFASTLGPTPPSVVFLKNVGVCRRQMPKDWGQI